MKINGRKVFGFIAIMIILTSILYTLLFTNNIELFKMLSPTIISAMVASFIILVGGNISTKFIKSKWFQPELNGEKENGDS